MTADNCQTCGHPKKWHNMDDGCRQYSWGRGRVCSCPVYTPVAAPDRKIAKRSMGTISTIEGKRLSSSRSTPVAAPDDEPLCLGRWHAWSYGKCAHCGEKQPEAPVAAREAAQKDHVEGCGALIYGDKFACHCPAREAAQTEATEERIHADFQKHPGSWRPDPENWFREGWIAGFLVGRGHRE